MASDWKSHKVGELADSISVTHPFDKKRLIFLNTSDILRGKVLHNSYKDIGSLPGQAKKTIKKDDILLSEIRPANGRYAFIDFEAENYVVSTKLMVIRAREKILPKFLFYFLTNKSITNWLQHLAESRSGTFPQITFDQIADLNVKLPNRDEQEKIIAYIDPIDEKIELNHQMNATLEKIGQALFKHWFIDFEFPNEKGKPYNSSGGKMVDSDLGEIPKGWRVAVLPDVCLVVDCLHTKKPEMVQEGPLLLQVYNIAVDGTLDFSEKYNVSENDYQEWTKNIEVKEGDCLITNAGRVGAVAQVRVGFKGGIGRNITAMRPNDVTFTYLFRYLFSNSGLREIERQTDQGTVLDSLNVKGIRKIRILVPPPEIMNKFEKIARPLREKVERNKMENDSLMLTRDSLLPRLMSGKIRVNAHGSGGCC